MEEALIGLLVDNVLFYSVMVVGLVMAAAQLGIDVAAALAGLGVVGLALAFAAQDSVANVISGIIIFSDKGSCSKP
jgi:small conductance mechanosensitive channel